MGTEPWIDPEGANIEKIKRVIRMCPSGALSYTENETETNEFFNEAEIIVSKNGPYYVRGSLEIKNVDLGDRASKEHYTLCRCGKSGNKPRCDGAQITLTTRKTTSIPAVTHRMSLSRIFMARWGLKPL